MCNFKGLLKIVFVKISNIVRYYVFEFIGYGKGYLFSLGKIL